MEPPIPQKINIPSTNYQQKIKGVSEVHNYKRTYFVLDFSLERHQGALEKSTITAAGDAGITIFLGILSENIHSIEQYQMECIWRKKQNMH